jgi:hypothetical protein
LEYVLNGSLGGAPLVEKDKMDRRDEARMVEGVGGESSGSEEDPDLERRDERRESPLCDFVGDQLRGLERWRREGVLRWVEKERRRGDLERLLGGGGRAWCP